MKGRMEDKPIRRTINAWLRLPVGRFSVFTSSGLRLIAAAAVLHVALAAGLFMAGRAQIAPRFLDRDAIIVASDSYEYRSGAVRMAGILKQKGLGAWAAEPERTHVKLISLQFALLAPVFGYSAFSAEPFNLFCYVAILSLVLMLGREVGGRRVGLLAACIVALWPTFLLHTTQLLKDPLFIAAALALILIVTTWLTRTYSWAGAAGAGAFMAVATGLLLLIRVKFVVFIFAIVFFGFALLIVRQLRERRLLYWNLVCPLLILCAGAIAPFYLSAGNQKFKQYPSDGSGQDKSAAATLKQVRGVISYPGSALSRRKPPQTYAGRLYAATDAAVLEIDSARYKYNVSYPESGSAIDRSVEYKNLKGLMLYLPRAFAIGFWSPFPGMWFGAGKSVGGAGRILSGAETLLMYLCGALAFLGIRRAPRSLPAWLLLLITTFGVTVLGLVVSNVGTLYRFRYLFWILLIILGVKGLESIFTAWRARTSNALERDGELKEVAPGGQHFAK
jgi:4-amino-4-deoxy-L-arabinose transferase-like glycosyltransferase